MPELHFELRWSETHSERYYSPSSKVRDYLQVGESYAVAELLQRARAALQLAAARVERKYGFTCSSAMETLQRIEQCAAGYAEQPDVRVRVTRIDY
jgi:uncharacterized repeat protein (TIGR04042 family)